MHPALIIIIVGAVIVLAGGLGIHVRMLRKGIRTEAVVTNVVRKWERVGGYAWRFGFQYHYTVRFRDREGGTVTAELEGLFLATGMRRFCCGDRVMIRYLKERPDRPYYAGRAGE
ncbi:MAG: hypothetical protein K6C09_06575 [Oscillospiraceae bacterium]|nr:hypothetical protein [Oscillospiraceae bacterium]